MWLVGRQILAWLVICIAVPLGVVPIISFTVGGGRSLTEMWMLMRSRCRVLLVVLGVISYKLVIGADEVDVWSGLYCDL